MNAASAVRSTHVDLFRPPTALESFLKPVNAVWNFSDAYRVSAPAPVMGRFAVGKLPFSQAFRMSYTEWVRPENPYPYFMDGLIKADPAGGFSYDGSSGQHTQFSMHTTGWEGDSITWTGSMTDYGRTVELREIWKLAPGGQRLGFVREFRENAQSEWTTLFELNTQRS